MSVDIKNLLVRITAVKLLIHEKVVEKVVDYQFKSANEAMGNNHHSIEMSGFGKFVFNNNKAKKKLVSLQKTVEILQNELDHPETAKNNPVFSKNVLKATKEHIASLKPMIKYD
jgi:nucleoid DNA-binding protein